MWLIKRVYMDGAGHEEAFYKDLTLDYIGLSQAVSSPVVEGLRSPVRNAKVVTSTYQQLVNGGGVSRPTSRCCYRFLSRPLVTSPNIWQIIARVNTTTAITSIKNSLLFWLRWSMNQDKRYY
ncbi:hypothetical protein ACSFU4_001678 [Escherichia coli]|uniref:hypothetical protein n=1 Tax=Escherichia coli TaxID=562 RepID=UPI0020324635|nr:hypothetical protein [Escherichia coli]